MVVARTGNVEAAQLLIGRKAEVSAKEEWRGQSGPDVGRGGTASRHGQTARRPRR